jgi:hypothetical protein
MIHLRDWGCSDFVADDFGYFGGSFSCQGWHFPSDFQTCPPAHSNALLIGLPFGPDVDFGLVDGLGFHRHSVVDSDWVGDRLFDSDFGLVDGLGFHRHSVVDSDSVGDRPVGWICARFAEFDLVLRPVADGVDFGFLRFSDAAHWG